jgi:hypothetical protein
MGESVIIRFHGPGSDVEELTWSQRSIWDSMVAAGRSIAIGGMVAMPAGTTVDQVATILRFATSRHQSLRTRLTFESDGRPRQVVSESGEIALTVVDVPDAGDPAATAEEIRARQELGTFDYVHEWPVWMSVVRHRGQVTHLVAMYSHLAVDGQGLAALVADLATMDPATGESAAPVEGVQPVDLARQQREPAAQRQSAAALRYWEGVLRSIPPRRFRACHDRREPRFWELDCHSPALLLAVRTIADRNRAGTGTVLLATYAVAMARVTGVNPSVAQVVVSNRFRPGFAGSVSHLAQYAPAVIDVADATFDDVVARARRAAMAANKYAYYDAAACAELIARVGRERGQRIDTACFYNDRRDESRDAVGPRPSREAVLDALPDTTRRWGRRFDWYDGLFFLHINEAHGAISYTAWADTHHLSPVDLESFVRQYESVAIEAILDPDALAVPAAVVTEPAAARGSSDREPPRW